MGFFTSDFFHRKFSHGSLIPFLNCFLIEIESAEVFKFKGHSAYSQNTWKTIFFVNLKQFKIVFLSSFVSSYSHVIRF